MTKLEWCRANAPTSLTSLSDADLLFEMRDILKNPSIPKPDFDVPLDDCELVMEMLGSVMNGVREKVGEHIAFSGGYVMRCLTESPTFPSHFLDIHIDNTVPINDVYAVVRECAEHYKSLGYIANIDGDESRMTMCNSNMRAIAIVTLHACDLTYGVTSDTNHRCVSPMISIERIIASQVLYLLSPNRWRRRMTLYELYNELCSFNFDANVVVDCMRHKAGNDSIDWSAYPFSNDVLNELERNYNKVTSHVVNDNIQAHPLFSAAFMIVNDVLSTLYILDAGTHWNHTTCSFEGNTKQLQHTTISQLAYERPCLIAIKREAVIGTSVECICDGKRYELPYSGLAKRCMLGSISESDDYFYTFIHAFDNEYSSRDRVYYFGHIASFDALTRDEFFAKCEEYGFSTKGL